MKMQLKDNHPTMEKLQKLMEVAFDLGLTSRS